MAPGLRKPDPYAPSSSAAARNMRRYPSASPQVVHKYVQLGTTSSGQRGCVAAARLPDARKTAVAPSGGFSVAQPTLLGDGISGAGIRATPETSLTTRCFLSPPP